MGWFNEDSKQFQAYDQVTKGESQASWTIELVAAGGSYAAAKAYEDYIAKNGSLPSKEKAQEIFLSASGAFIDQEVEKHSLKSIDKDAAKQSAKKQVGDAFEKLGGIDPRKILSRESFEQLKTRLLKKEEGYVMVETPKEDLEAINNLLKLSPGTAASQNTAVKLPEGGQSCANCGRQYSILDIVSTGLGIHGSTFLKDIVLGKYGYVYNPRGDKDVAFHNCYKCGTRSTSSFAYYTTPYYAWSY
ncbi:hypothetical protein CPB84DRAFT_1783638 [Gymnopilus junonius]|uniref:Uncharacterized protein n=1 Tax=Gymnopilus junonius TaxID=109634 RepID=A0A9P5NJI9_GYMJU|nr:hypothetical protein CPB84DRAFT_1783638 [Gymnopilus junonius]